jgi:hypothetical protein
MPDASGFISTRSLSVHRADFGHDVCKRLPKPLVIMHTVQAHDRKDSIKWVHERWKPSVYKPLDALHGSCGKRKRDGSIKLRELPIRERIKKYREALGIVHTFESWEDLVPLAVYRRRVTNVAGDRRIDAALLQLVERAVEAKFFRPIEIKYLADRMPSRSVIRGLLYLLAVRELKKRTFKLGSV